MARQFQHRTIDLVLLRRLGLGTLKARSAPKPKIINASILAPSAFLIVLQNVKLV
jgi:hypothetical protein